MAESVFREFVRFANRHWKSRVAGVRRIPKALSSILPAASTFDFGVIEQTGQPLFVHLQNSWQPNDTRAFTVNVVLSDDSEALRGFGGSLQSDFVSAKPGRYRLGSVVHGRDKRWCLGPDPVGFALVWRASSYDDQAAIFGEAIADVTQDLERMLELARFTRG